MVKTLKHSLEFSYNEIDGPKKENANLRIVVESLELEDKRTQFQIKDLEEKVDAATKRRNLVFDVLSEVEGKWEEV